MRPFSDDESIRIIANALEAAKRSILADFATICLTRTDVPNDVWQTLATEASDSFRRALWAASDSLRLTLKDEDEPPGALATAIAEFCSESPRETEELVEEIYVFVRCSKSKVRDLIRTMEERGVIRNLAQGRGRHRWVAASSRWGAPRCVPEGQL